MSQLDHDYPMLIAIHSDVLLPKELQVHAADVLPATAPRIYALQGSTHTIGRDTEKCQIWVRPERFDVSRVHAAIVQINGQSIIVDKKSTHGTFVNHQRIQEPSILKTNDVIGLAHTSEMLRFVNPHHRRQIAPLVLGLTDREREVLVLLVRGQSYKSIAGELKISENTVKTHLQHIYEKFRVNDREAATDIARKLDLF